MQALNTDALEDEKGAIDEHISRALAAKLVR